VTLAGIVRALVATALREDTEGLPVPDPDPELLNAAIWNAARHGLSAALVDPREALPRPAAGVVASMLAHLEPALTDAGDLRRVTTGPIVSCRTAPERNCNGGPFVTGGLRALTRTIGAHTTPPPQETSD